MTDFNFNQTIEYIDDKDAPSDKAARYFRAMRY